jgi:hypothetical protein
MCQQRCKCLSSKTVSHTRLATVLSLCTSRFVEKIVRAREANESAGIESRKTSGDWTL